MQSRKRVEPGAHAPNFEAPDRVGLFMEGPGPRATEAMQATQMVCPSPGSLLETSHAAHVHHVTRQVEFRGHLHLPSHKFAHSKKEPDFIDPHRCMGRAVTLREMNSSPLGPTKPRRTIHERMLAPLALFRASHHTGPRAGLASNRGAARLYVLHALAKGSVQPHGSTDVRKVDSDIQ
ncbi:hypothetical protein LIA77_06920 [Sarocladium implicatum]|nr:hypothetical protein LIA77_06920 [Sarocladium implicatum]